VTKAWLVLRLQENAAYQYERQLRIYLISGHKQVTRVVLQLTDGTLTINIVQNAFQSLRLGQILWHDPWNRKWAWI
jgi:hypothetical protein